MNKERILITGISGFIGEELAQKCLKEGYEVAGLIRQSFRYNDAINRLKGKVKLYEGSLNDYARLANIILDYMPDYVAHLGAITPVSYSFEHPWEVTNTNYIGTINITEALKRHCPNLKKFVFASSMETYGHQPEYHKLFKPFDEKTPQMGACPYACAKIAAEKYVKYLNYAYKFPGISLRQTNCYGRKDNDYFVAEAFITQMLKNKEVNFGNPEPVRNFLYIDDLTDLYLTLFKSDNPEILGKSFTVGPPNGITIGELADIIAEKLNWKGKTNWYTREIRDGEIYYLNSSNKLISQMTGWKPKVNLSDGLDMTIEHWKKKLGV